MAIVKYKSQHETVLGEAPHTDVPEMKISFNKSKGKIFVGKITSSSDVAKFIRGLYQNDDIILQEHVLVLYLNQSNKIIGYYRHTVGGITSSIVDIRLILGVALQTGAVGIIVAHNHPSGSLSASEPDKYITRKLKEAGKLLEVQLMDHLIVTKDGYWSFADEGLLGIYKKTNNNMAKKTNKINCRPSYKISEAGHLLATRGYSKSGSILSKEGKKEKRKRKARGCLNGPAGTFQLTEKQKRNLPKHLQKAIIAHHKKLGKTIYN